MSTDIKRIPISISYKSLYTRAMGSMNVHRLFNVVLIVFVAYLLVQRVPGLLTMYQMQGQALGGALQVQNLEPHLAPTQNLLQGKPRVMVFWATWCGPCKVELKRLNSLVEQQKVSPEDILAISVGESAETVKAYVESEKLLFNVGLDSRSEIARIFKVQGTPTVVLLNAKGDIDWMTMGVSPSLEYRVLSHLKTQ